MHEGTRSRINIDTKLECEACKYVQIIYNFIKQNRLMTDFFNSRKIDGVALRSIASIHSLVCHRLSLTLSDLIFKWSEVRV